MSKVDPDLQVVWIVECKPVSHSRAIGVEEVRDLHMARIDSGASNALLVTTGRFTEGAKVFTQTKRELHLVDYEQIVVWLHKCQ